MKNKIKKKYNSKYFIKIKNRYVNILNIEYIIYHTSSDVIGRRMLSYIYIKTSDEKSIEIDILSISEENMSYAEAEECLKNKSEEYIEKLLKEIDEKLGVLNNE